MGGAWRTLRRGCCEAVVASGVARERRWVMVMVAFEYWGMQPLEPAGDMPLWVALATRVRWPQRWSWRVRAGSLGR